jgi:hypothetical protein
MRFGVLIIFLAVLALPLKAQLLISGIYGGQPILFSSTGINDSCKRIIVINNTQLPDTFGDTGYLDPSQLRINKGDSITIKITSTCSAIHTSLLNTYPHYHHYTGLKPAIVSADTSGKIAWLHDPYHDSAYYTVQVFRWNKWVTLNKINADTSNGLNKYETKINLHSGENKIQVNYWSPKKNYPVSSALIYIQTPEKEICNYLKSPKDTIYFEQETSYEIYDQYGELIKRGTGKFIDISDLKRQMFYYINYDNQMKIFHLR